MKSLHGFYRGIIVQNNDPQKLGRVKVFIPHIHMAMLDIEKEDYDKEFYFAEFGTNYQKKDKNLVDLTKYIEKAKLKLPWAEVSLPITGGGYSSFNSGSNRATISDSPNFANQIADGKIIGWFQERSEFGPRALGNRSILADPRKKNINAIIISDYDKGLLTDNLCQTIISYSNKNNIRTFIDPKLKNCLKYKFCHTTVWAIFLSVIRF